MGLIESGMTMPSSVPAIAFVWADEHLAGLDAELAVWLGQRRRRKPSVATRVDAFVAARPRSARGTRR